MELNIILIEDEPDTCEMIETWLEDLGRKPQVKTFSMGAGALEFMEQEMAKGPASDRFVPDLVILDLKLPDQSGLEVLKKMKLSKALKNIEVIVNSAADDPESLRNTYKFGGCIFIQKKGEPKLLLDAIRRLMMAGRVRRPDELRAL